MLREPVLFRGNCDTAWWVNGMSSWAALLHGLWVGLTVDGSTPLYSELEHSGAKSTRI